MCANDHGRPSYEVADPTGRWTIGNVLNKIEVLLFQLRRSKELEEK
jgi:hypothetical protein